VVSSFPLRAVLHNPNATGNIAKWAAELAEFELDFVPCHAVKSQVLADFIVDWTPSANHPEGPRCSAPEPGAPAFIGPHWTLFFDGSSRGEGAGAGVLLLAPQGDQFKYMIHLDFKATNNMAEYEALLYGLSTTLSLGVRRLLVKGDSQLIIKQVRGECCCNDPQMAAYLLRARELEKDFEILDLRHIPRAENAVADDLSAKASTSAPVPDGVLERWLHQPTARTADLSEGGGSSTPKLVVPAVLVPWSPLRIIGATGGSVYPGTQDPETQAGPDTWITEFRTYLKDNILPDDMAFADRIAHLAKRYTLVEGDLYRRGANGILMRCITREEGCDLLTDVHGGECGNHASSCTLVGKAFQHGFYWPTSLQDAVKQVRSCRASHFHAKQIHTPAQTLQMIPPHGPSLCGGWTSWGHFPAPSEGTGSSTSPSTNSPSGRKQHRWSTSTSNPQSSSSTPSYADLGSRTESSPTTGPSLLVAPFKGTAKIWAYRSATRPLPILRAMGRWSAPT
jgi:ribonuclease HI